jgi:hypothetical protein
MFVAENEVDASHAEEMLSYSFSRYAFWKRMVFSDESWKAPICSSAIWGFISSDVKSWHLRGHITVLAIYVSYSFYFRLHFMFIFLFFFNLFFIIMPLYVQLSDGDNDESKIGFFSIPF